MANKLFVIGLFILIGAVYAFANIPNAYINTPGYNNGSSEEAPYPYCTLDIVTEGNEEYAFANEYLNICAYGRLHLLVINIDTEQGIYKGSGIIPTPERCTCKIDKKE